MNDISFYNMLITFGLLAVFIVLAVFFLLTLQNTLKAIEPQNRTMEPRKVWWLFIPFFNIVWVFYVISAIANSGKNQLTQYGLFSEQRPTYSLGIAWAICTICNRVPLIGPFCAFASLVLFIAYWVKVNDLRKQILALRETYSEEENSIFR